MKRVLVTAGPTRERIDPVRFISNYSTGVFGYEIASEARRRGMRVVLVSGPTALCAPRGVRRVQVESALEMRRAVLREFKKADCIIMAAAVGDWRVRVAARNKIKRNGRARLELIENPDILAEVGRKKGKRVLIGFALETEALERNARKKLEKKNLDIIVANKISPVRNIFGRSATDVLIMDKTGRKMRIRNRSKREIAKLIIGKVLAQYA